MTTLLLLNKPFRVMCQFTDGENRATLADYVNTPGVYPAGRLDYDSEGLLLLTDDGRLQQKISDPKYKLAKTYWAQVEGIPDAAALQTLRQGVTLNDGITRPAKATLEQPPSWLWPRNPPIRQRNHDVISWLRLELTEGKNRQVRRMTAAIGHPTLRLIRTHIGQWSIAGLPPGAHRQEAAPASSRR